MEDFRYKTTKEIVSANDKADIMDTTIIIQPYWDTNGSLILTSGLLA